MTNDCIEIVMDSDLVSEYTRHYFAEHPRASKPPIAGPTHPSINQWMVLQRQAMNTLKQKWKDFSAWVIRKNGYEGSADSLNSLRTKTLSSLPKSLPNTADSGPTRSAASPFAEIATPALSKSGQNPLKYLAFA